MKHIALAVCSILSVGHANAGNLGQIGSLVQDQFHHLSADLGAAAAYKGVIPATSLGLVGFDVGAELTQTRFTHADVFRAAGADVSSLYTLKLHITKGLPWGMDIGTFVSRTSGISGSLIGGEIRYAILDDGLTTPALGVRLSGSKLTGVSQLDLHTIAVDATLSKKFLLLTPYAGVGVVRINSESNAIGLKEEKFNKSRTFIGLNANFLLSNVALEAERLGSVNSISAKLGFRF